MVLKALLVGLNYKMHKENLLLSPVNNIEILKDFLISFSNFKNKNIKLLSDDERHDNATFFSITACLKNIISSSSKNDVIVLYFSGYGDFLGTLEKDDPNYSKEKMKLSSLYKQKNPENIFLPQDFGMACLTKDYFFDILNKSESRIFLMFDNYNQNKINLKNYYDINSETYNTFIGTDKNTYTNELTCLSVNSEKSNFDKFHKVNLINNNINKFYSNFLIIFLKHLYNYLQININFITYKYSEMYKNIIIQMKDHRMNFSSMKEEKNMNTGCCKHEDIEIFLSFSKKELIDTCFLDNKIQENKEKEMQDLEVNKKMKTRDKVLAYKNVGLERDMKILKKRYNHILNEYNKMQNIMKKSNSIQYSFNKFLN
tara:strand:- start:1791 stop:2903 length:1113 start_codon:yes stop_codon:yes gene_type:complete